MIEKKTKAKPIKRNKRSKRSKSRAGGKRYQCGQCDKSYAFRFDYNTHVKVKHEGSISYRCDLCDINFTKNFSLKVHYNNKHLGLPFQCDKRDESFMKSYALKRHLKVMHGKVHATNVLQKDNLSFNLHQNKHPTVLLKRISKKLIESFQQIDPKTKYSTNEKRILQDRRVSIRLERLSPDTIERYQSLANEQDDNLILPVKETSKKISKSTKKFSCLKCMKKFGTRPNLKQHDRIVHQKIKFHCNKCPEKVFSTKQNLRFHMNFTHHGLHVECKKCQKKFRRQTELNLHERKVHQKRKLS